MSDEVTKKLQERLRASQAAKELSKPKETGSEDEPQNKSQNLDQNKDEVSKNGLNDTPNEDETPEIDSDFDQNKAQNALQNALENDKEHLENAKGNDSETPNNLSDKDENDAPSRDPLYDHIDEEEEEEDEDEDEEGEDGEEAESTTPAEAIQKITGESAENLQNLADLGELVLDLADEWKADLCSAWSGEKNDNYTSNEKTKKAVVNAAKEYLSSKEMRAPTPLGTLIIAILVWGGPSVVLAAWHSHQAKKAAKELKEASGGEQKADAPKVEKPDYSHLKEVQEKRRLFTLHKTTGTYNKRSNSDFWKLEEGADEKPSPEILKMIEEGKKCPEIRSIIYDD